MMQNTDNSGEPVLLERATEEPPHIPGNMADMLDNLHKFFALIVFKKSTYIFYART